MTKREAKLFIKFWSDMQCGIKNVQEPVYGAALCPPDDVRNITPRALARGYDLEDAAFLDMVSRGGVVNIKRLDGLAHEWQRLFYKSFHDRLTRAEEEDMHRLALMRHNYIEDLICYGNRMLEVAEEDDAVEIGEPEPCA